MNRILFPADAGLNTEVSVLNKINASNVLTLRTLQDANNLRVAALEQQVLQAKQQRDSDAANLNFAIQMRQQADAKSRVPSTATSPKASAAIGSRNAHGPEQRTERP